MKYTNQMSIVGRVTAVHTEKRKERTDLIFGVETVSGMKDILTNLICIYPVFPGDHAPVLEKDMWVKVNGTLRMDTWKNGKPRAYVLAEEPEILLADIEKEMRNLIVIQGYLAWPVEPCKKGTGIKALFTVCADDEMSHDLYIYRCMIPDEDRPVSSIAWKMLKGDLITVGSVWAWYEEEGIGSVANIVVKRVDIDEFSAMYDVAEILRKKGANGFVSKATGTERTFEVF